MILNSWAEVKYVAGGQTVLPALLNSLIHVMMYLYYGLAAMGPHMTKYLWWKRYLTSLQLVKIYIIKGRPLRKKLQTICSRMKDVQTFTMWQELQLIYHETLEKGDKRTDDWLLVYSPLPICCIFLCYMVVIWVGPKMMANREPINIKPVMIVYNFAVICLCAYMFYEVRPCAATSADKI
ncbi:hypothetical protein LDENG_00213910 [Lucifuga dentata]|nr:hypothetical protein LDENG_00213910 [Lucifuga dentata]